MRRIYTFSAVAVSCGLSVTLVRDEVCSAQAYILDTSQGSSRRRGRPHQASVLLTCHVLSHQT
eukprot:1180543-Prorocentrum_minimum.AAC.2